MKFKTSDQDNDKHKSNCATLGKRVGSGRWFNGCDSVCFTLAYANNKEGLTTERCIQWDQWKDSEYSLKYAGMMIRRI